MAAPQSASNIWKQKAPDMNDLSSAPTNADLPVSAARPDQNFDLLAGVSIRVSVEVGSAAMRLSDLLNVAEGSVIELDRAANELLDLFANGTLIARGEIVDVDGRYGIRVVEVVNPDRRFAPVDRRL
jgi:flagellar motor switch protein FliN